MEDEAPTINGQKSSRNRSPRQSPRSNDTSGNGAKRECACGRGMACAGMTQAFRMLGDPRRHFVELPHYRHDPPSFKYKFRNNLRASYIRNLEKCNSDLDMSKFDNIRRRRFVALHHFHPDIVKAFYDNPLTSAQKHKVPISITEHEMRELSIQMCEEDRIMTVEGTPTGGYFFGPNYPPMNVHEDLKTLVRKERLLREAKETTDNMDSNRGEILNENDAAISEVSGARKPMIAPIVNEAADDSSTEDVVDASKDRDESESADFDDILEKDDGPSKFDELWGKEQPLAGTASATQPEITVDLASMPGDANAEEALDAKSTSGADDLDSQEGKALHPVEESKEELYRDISGNEGGSVESLQRGTMGAKGPSMTAVSHGDSQGESNAVNGPEANHEKQEAKDSLSPYDSSNDKSEVEEEAAEQIAVAAAHQLGSEGDPKKQEGVDELNPVDAAKDITESSSPRKLAARNSDHPWDLSKYRIVELETQQKRTSAAFIEPKTQSPSKEELESKNSEPDGISPRKTPAGMNIIEEGSREVSTGLKTDRTASDADKMEAPEAAEFQYLDFYDDDDSKSRNKYQASFSISKSASHDSGESKSAASVDSVSSNAIGLNHELPGSDPTLRIQVHNDLIAIESKRRSEMKILLDFHKEQWYTAREILQTGVQNVEYAERLVSGFAQAGMVFADTMEAMYEDRFLDDRGKTVKRKFVQNRLHKRRSLQEYSIDTAQGELGQSALLKSLIEAQLAMAKSFDESARHLLEEMLPEITDLRHEIQELAHELELLGDRIVGQLISSEIEVKNIWDVFDALVTGDLMEYSVHGSQHGSTHGESSHSVGSVSLHGLIPEVSSNASGQSPIKSTFRELDSIGSIEDGWLIELLYKSAISCQKNVFRFAKPELDRLYQEISIFEEKRLRKLHPLMMAFVPRQSRLFDALPDHMKGVLDDLVGFRIDEESLQTHIDDTLRDRSSDRLKKSEKHRSSIMNRSRLKAAKNTPESVDEIERVYGSPFFSSLILLSNVVELKPFGFSGMVNNAWRYAIVLITKAGYFHVFMMPREVESPLDQSPLEAFKSLYPAMQFETQQDWVRKQEIKRRLTPSITLNLRMCDIRVSSLELELTEEEVQHRSSFFGKKILKAVKDGGQRPTKCTMRLPSANGATQLAEILQKTKKDLLKKQKPQYR